MAPQKLKVYDVMSEAQAVAKCHWPLSLLFILPLSFSIVAYPILQQSLATSQPKFSNLFPFNGDPIVFKPLCLFFTYLFTLLCLSTCAMGTISYSVYHGFSGKPVRLIYAVKSLSNSLLRLFATFICAHALILVGLAVIGFIVFTINSGFVYLGLDVELQCSFVHFRVFNVLGWVIFGLGVFCLYGDWGLAPVIVVVESSWGFEPLKRSAFLIKGNTNIVIRLLVSICGMMYLSVVGFGSWGHFYLFGSSVYGSTLVIVMLALGSYLLSTHLLQCLIAVVILYKKCKALQEELPEEISQKYVSLPLDDEEKVANVV